jgi:quercetin dioxygenase-like cupin family protein
MHRFLLVLGLVCFTGVVAKGQDPVKVDPTHYKLVSENAEVRVLRFHYGPHEKSVMHAHPNLVVVYLTDMNVKMTLPDGKSVEQTGKAGEAQWTPAGIHLPENMSDKPIEGILVEMKHRSAAKPAAKSHAKAAAKPAQ